MNRMRCRNTLFCPKDSLSSGKDKNRDERSSAAQDHPQWRRIDAFDLFSTSAAQKFRHRRAGVPNGDSPTNQ